MPEQHDEFAHQTYGGEVRPVDIQCLTSYAVIAGPCGENIIQFREKAALLDMNRLAVARDIHGDVVTRSSDSTPLAIETVQNW
ncbi:hypothetical protein VTK73DRAFT_6420 [Phialemonium thermophilum]|uniref:Uncharacterized protein n=1 Tax=Phialemonium thermophilum TaxID=223376 RepID=A0ABR3WJK4_9PEZI